LIKAVHPDTLIAVEETYTEEQIKQLAKFCGRVVVLPRQATTSTSAKIRTLQIGMAGSFEKILTPRVMKAIEDTINEIKGNGKPKGK
jgi:hypothetical protein